MIKSCAVFDEPFVSTNNLMADMEEDLWVYNLVKVTVIDVSDDYRLLQPPMPSECYPVINVQWMPRYKFLERLTSDELVNGYLYDWHETTGNQFGPWFVGVVERNLALPIAPPSREGTFIQPSL